MGRPERPLDPDAGPLQRFAWQLRGLRRESGGPAYRKLAGKAHYSATALSAAASGEQLPSLAVTLAYVEACGGDRAQWEARWRAVAAQLGDSGPTSDTERSEASPYRGLVPFRPQDANRFHGRQRLVDTLLARLEDTPFLTLFGASGSGKSSLLQAGLLPVVAARPGWHAVAMTPGAHPLAELAVQLSALRRIPPGALHADLVADPARLDLAVRQAVAGGPPEARVLLVVDQFEELFTLCEGRDERAAFVDALAAAVTGASSRARVALGVRADFYGHCADHPALLAALADGQVLLGPMDRDELREAIVRPAVDAGLTVEPALVATVIADVADRPGTLPLMSHALLETWRRRRGRTLTLAGYQAAGGVRGAIAQTAERAYELLDDDGRELARRMFLRLTAVGWGNEDTGRRANRDELLALADDDSARTVLDHLARARLISIDADSVELAHEALIREWPRLRHWLTADRESVRVHRRLTDAAGEWDAEARDQCFLYRGARLAAWQDRSTADLNSLERAFLRTSLQRKAAETAARRRRTSLTIGGLSLALVIISLLAVTAVVQRDEARDQRDTASARRLATAATAQLAIDPELALLLALKAYEVRPVQEAETALRQALVDSRVRATSRDHTGPVTSVASGPDGRVASAGADGTIRVHAGSDGTPPRVLRGHDGPVDHVAISGDGGRLAAAGADGTVRVWNDADQVVALRGHDGPVTGIAFSGRDRLITSGADGTVRIWDAEGRATVLTRAGDPVTGVAVSPDGRFVAFAGGGRPVQVREIAGGGAPILLQGYEGAVNDLAFSADGRHLAVAGEDTVGLWDLTTGEQTAVLREHDGPVNAVEFSPDGRHLATAGADETVRIWNAAGRGQPVVLRGHDGAVSGVAFGPGPGRVVSAGEDGTVRTWQWAGESTRLHGDGGAAGAVVSPDGRTIASGYHGGVVRIWDLARQDGPVVLSGHTGPVNNVAFSPDGKSLAGAGSDGAVRVWRTADHVETAVLQGHTGPVFDVAFSPDGTRLASVGRDGVVRIWHTTGGRAAARLHGHDGAVMGVAFSPDGRRLAAAGDDGIRVWDLEEGGAPTPLRGHDGAVLGITFTADGSRVVSAGNDGTVRIWDLSGRTDTVVLRGHEGPVFRVGASPDGRRVASAGNDGTVRVWDLRRDGAAVVLRGHENEVNSAVFTPDGRRIVSASDDTTVRVWDCEACGAIQDVPALARTRATRELTEEERKMFLAPR